MAAAEDFDSMANGAGDSVPAVEPEAPPPPPGPPPGLDLTEDLGPMLNAVFWFLVALAFVFIVLRIYCKFRGSRGLWWDDWILIASWIMFFIDAILTSVIINLGYGKHVFALDPVTLPPIGLIGFLSGTAALLAASWSKTSIAITMLRLTTDWSKYVIWFMIVTMNIALTLSAIFPYISCQPMHKAWDISSEGTCWPLTLMMDYGTFSGVYSGIVDIALALMALKIVAGLQMKQKEKIGVAIAMSMGILAGVAAFIRIAHFHTLSSGDFTSCIPVLRVLIRDAQTKIAARYYGATGTSSSTAVGTSASKGDKRKTGPSNITAVSAGDDIMMDDKSSQKSILNHSSSVVSAGAIMRTDAVAVEFEDRKGGDNGYEMSNV